MVRPEPTDRTPSEYVRDIEAERIEQFKSRDVIERLLGTDPGERDILALATSSATAARETFTKWSYTESQPEVRYQSALAADQRQKHVEFVSFRLPDDHAATDGGSFHEYVRSKDDSRARVAAGFIARGIVAANAYDRFSDYFDGRDERLVQLFEELAADERSTVETGDDLLVELGHSREDLVPATDAIERATAGLSAP